MGTVDQMGRNALRFTVPDGKRLSNAVQEIGCRRQKTPNLDVSHTHDSSASDGCAPRASVLKFARGSHKRTARVVHENLRASDLMGRTVGRWNKTVKVFRASHLVSGDSLTSSATSSDTLTWYAPADGSSKAAPTNPHEWLEPNNV